MSMNDMSVKIEQLLKLQKGVCEQYEKENKELTKTTSRIFVQYILFY